MHTQLKKFGFGRPQMEAFVQDEAQVYILLHFGQNNFGQFFILNCTTQLLTKIN
jgi:hypothetical protein